MNNSLRRFNGVSLRIKVKYDLGGFSVCVSVNRGGSSSSSVREVGNFY